MGILRGPDVTKDPLVAIRTDFFFGGGRTWERPRANPDKLNIEFIFKTAWTESEALSGRNHILVLVVSQDIVMFRVRRS